MPPQTSQRTGGIENTTAASGPVLHAHVAGKRHARFEDDSGRRVSYSGGRAATLAALPRSSLANSCPDRVTNSARYWSEIGAAFGSSTVRGFLWTPFTRYS